MPKEFSGDKALPFKTVSQLIADGEKLQTLDALKWTKGQGARQTAYLCYSSGTSGLPVRIISQVESQLLIVGNLERCHDQP